MKGCGYRLDILVEKAGALQRNLRGLCAFAVNGYAKGYNRYFRGK